MTNVHGALRQIRQTELAGIGLGMPSESSRTRFQRTLSLVAASKVIDRLDPTVFPKQVTDEVSDDGQRLAVDVERVRSARVVIPEEFEEGIPGQRITLLEGKTSAYKAYPFGLRGLWPLLKTHGVTMLVELDKDDEWPPAITLRGSNKIGFNETPTDIETITVFNNKLALIARAEGFERELAIQELFLPEWQPADAA